VGLRKEQNNIWIPGENFRAVGGTSVAPWPDHLTYYSQGAAEAVFAAAQSGVYRIQVACAGTAGGDALPRFKVSLDGRPVGAETPLTRLDPARYAFEAELRPGDHRLGVEFTNDFCRRNERGDLLEDRNFVLIGVRLSTAP
jgi:Ca-dependent carbohydrate-binding module xylan-binding